MVPASESHNSVCPGFCSKPLGVKEVEPPEPDGWVCWKLGGWFCWISCEGETLVMFMGKWVKWPPPQRLVCLDLYTLAEKADSSTGPKLCRVV